MKRMVVLSDPHCGSKSGLTPPGWRSNSKSPLHHDQKYAAQQELMWNWFTEKIDALGKIDVLLANGDMIDGTGIKQGGTEQLTTDPDEQALIACEVIQRVGAKKVVMTYGTPYHTGYGTDFENIIYRETGAEKIESEGDFDIGGVVFNSRHFVSSSIIPHGRYTALAREQLWNELLASRKGHERADVIIRSHVHYHVYCGFPGTLMVTTPSLQGYGSKYGSRRCSGLIDIGFIYFECDNGRFEWGNRIMDGRLIAPKKLTL